MTLPWGPGREDGGGHRAHSAFCMDLAGLVITLLSSASGEKQECSSGAGHFAAVPASTSQCPAAVQEPSGQPTHQPLSLSQPQGNRSLSGMPSVDLEVGVLTGDQVSLLLIVQ